MITISFHPWMIIPSLIAYIIIGTLVATTFFRRLTQEGMFMFACFWPITLSGLVIYAVIAGTIKEMIHLADSP